LIGATHYYTKEQEGLLLLWYGRMFLNPPYARGVIERFVRKSIAEYESGHVQEANLLVRPCTDIKWYQELLQYPVCFLRSHITFYIPYTSYKGKAFIKNTYKNYFGSSFHCLGKNTQRFAEVFGEVGIVKY